MLLYMKECINDFRSYFFHNGLDFSCELASPKKHYKPQINKGGYQIMRELHLFVYFGTVRN